MSVKTVEWTGRAVRLLDQTLLPGRVKFVSIRNEKEMWDAIRRLVVRGAPAIGVAAAWGVYVGVAARKPKSGEAARKATRQIADYLATSRPTAVNLFWALGKSREAVDALGADASAGDVLAALKAMAEHIQRDDEERCAAIARHGAPLLKGVRGVLTHCNAGALATAGVGTAVGVILEAAKRGAFTVYVDETRPLLQGARLTAWEMKQAGVEHRLIADSMAATAMQRGYVQAVVVGADRIAANGDAANKIGTMPLAICARHFGVPFYVAAPMSTVDFAIKSGDQIPIEERRDDEITHVGGKPMAPQGTRTFNPAFDTTPAKLIAGIVTEKGVARAPYGRSLREMAEGAATKRKRG